MDLPEPSEPASHDHPNPFARLPLARWVVQLVCAAFVVLVGFEFARFHAAALSGAGPLPARPAAVEALLPISALMALRRFVATGAWDDLHPAGLTILVAVIASALLARKAFCSWVCPVGTLSRALEWVGGRLGWMRRRKPSQKKSTLALIGHAPKYVVLGFFLYMMFVVMDVRTVSEFLGSPYNHVADARLLAFFAAPSGTAIVVIGAFFVGSLFVRHLWCRFVCPYGAFLGLVAWASPQRVVRDAATCTSCKRCTQVCPSAIRVHTELVVLTPECTGCMDCVTVCPVEDCLTVGAPRRKGWAPVWVPVVAIAVLLGAYVLARANGRWYSKVPAAEFAERYRTEAMQAEFERLHGGPPR
ncbi:MAG: 4Fe-4S binding protein [Candidatus Eisenbacteria bacterium]|uniref:4Fe-4S binding protein n=1 Tax=Eiseniibacteriota bacterium TaxID=2212470 RepID=A0A933SF40_UNCEI|nr:4Fe-4S binding protein [Candidatus Eisenbacteria bacterium]